MTLVNSAIEQDKQNLSLHLLKIKIDSRKKDLNAVISDYETLLKMYPDKDELQYALAKVYVLAKKTAEAEKLLVNLAETKPNQVKPKLVLLSFYSATDKAKADVKFNEFIASAKDNHTILIALAKWGLMANKTEQAKTVLTSLIDSDTSADQKVEPQLLLANIHFQEKKFDLASALVDKILDENSNQSDAKLLKAKILVQNDKLDDAVALLNTVLWDMPNSDETMVMLGNIFLLQGKPDEAEKKFKEALEINPANIQALFPVVENEINRNQADYAAQLLEKALARAPTQLILLNKLAQIKLAKKEWPTVESIVKSMEKIPGGFKLSQLVKGKLYQEQGNHQNAINQFQETLTKYPKQTELLSEMARSYEALNQRSKMLSFLKTFTEKNPQDISAIILKSKLLSLDKKYDESISILSDLVSKSPKVLPAYSELARLYIQRNQSDKAIETFDKGLEIDPENADLSMQKASLLIKNNKYQEAVALYEKIIEKNQRLDVARNNLATLLLDQIGTEEAIQKAVKLVERFKFYEQPFFLDTYAWAEFKSNRYNEALNVLQKVVVAKHEVPTFRYHLANVYKALGNTTQAVAELREALNLAKDNNFPELDAAKKLLIELSGNSNIN